MGYLQQNITYSSNNILSGCYLFGPNIFYTLEVLHKMHLMVFVADFEFSYLICQGHKDDIY